MVAVKSLVCVKACGANSFQDRVKTKTHAVAQLVSGA